MRRMTRAETLDPLPYCVSIVTGQDTDAIPYLRVEWYVGQKYRVNP